MPPHASATLSRYELAISLPFSNAALLVLMWTKNGTTPTATPMPISVQRDDDDDRSSPGSTIGRGYYAHLDVLRIVINEIGEPALPPLDLESEFAIGSAATAKVRLPAEVALGEHVRVDAAGWRAIGEVRVAGQPATGGAIGDGVVLELGRYRVAIAPAPAGAIAASPQRTASLARELVRSLLGADSAPQLTVERGPIAGASRALAPPESTLVIGRGDEAGWVIADDDLSRTHTEIRRGWDGARISDLGSKNGTKLDGARVTDAELHDGSLIELGNLALRFRDPAERHLRGGAVTAKPTVESVHRARSFAAFYVALAVAALAVVGLIALLAQ
jgi:hypothetical protein